LVQLSRFGRVPPDAVTIERETRDYPAFLLSPLRRDRDPGSRFED